MDKETWVPAIRLFIITIIAGLLLGITYNVTQKAINAKKDDSALREVLQDAAEFKKVEVNGNDKIKEVYEGIKDGNNVGYAIVFEAKGFKGPLNITIGIGKDDKITGMKLEAPDDTVGLGKEAEKPEFLNQFKDKSPETELKVAKTAQNPDEIQALSGATITSKGAVDGVNMVLNFYKTELKGGQK